VKSHGILRFIKSWWKNSTKKCCLALKSGNHHLFGVCMHNLGLNQHTKRLYPLLWASWGLILINWSNCIWMVTISQTLTFCHLLSYLSFSWLTFHKISLALFSLSRNVTTSKIIWDWMQLTTYSTLKDTSGWQGLLSTTITKTRKIRHN